MKLLFTFTFTFLNFSLFSQILDVPFRQATSVKYEMAEELADAQLKKVLVDYNDIVYVLTEQGLYRDYFGAQISKDRSYRSLSDKIPVDITLQEGSGILYYLYPDQYLSHTHAGRILAFIPENTYQHISVNSQGIVLLCSESKAAIYEDNTLQSELSLPEGEMKGIYTYQNNFYYLTSDAIYRLKTDSWELLHKGESLNDLAFRAHTAYVGTSEGFYVVDLFDGNIVQQLKQNLPVPNITQLQWVNLTLWFATPDGAYLQEPDRYRYFASKRWLDQNEIIDVASDSGGDIYLLTPTGLNKIEYVEHTLRDKAVFFQDNIRQYHMRYGFVCAPQIPEPFDLTSAEIVDHDNDGLWTSFYLGSQAFRYATTGEPVARRYVWESFEAYERLITINPIEGFPSRTFERTSAWVKDPDRWRTSEEKGWDWKGTTSTDEYIAYLFVATVMDQLVVENAEERQRVADFIDAILTHIIENDYYFVDYDGEPTLWGRWNPEYVNKFPKHVYDRKLNSTHLIAGLQLGYALSGKERYKDEAIQMMEAHGYYENMMVDMYDIRADTVIHQGVEMGDSWNHSDDEMAFLTYWCLYHYAFNDTLKQDYAWMIRNHWEIEQPERNGLWNLITYGTIGEMNRDDVIWFFREYNLDQMSYAVRNSHRKDLEFLPSNFRNQTTQMLLTPGERRTHRHNANPFGLDGGGDGISKLAGDEYLLPYWMARYLGVLE